MCFYLIADIILDVLSLIALIFRILQKLLRLPFAFWRTLVEWNQSIQRGIRHLLMPRINANGDIFNAPVPNDIPGTLRRRTLRIAPVNGTWNETTGTTPSFVVTHYDDDSNNDDLHGTERGVEGSLAASVDELIAAEGQRSEQGAQEQEPHQPRPQQLGQQPLGQQRSEPLGHELQQLGPQQQSSELSPREPMPRERVLPQQDSGEPMGNLERILCLYILDQMEYSRVDMRLPGYPATLSRFRAS
ncbi:hypothetical protein ANOM_007834 [Aspergillus nomiae NRRL 13137]|uniref:Uncharacterized protein n=1 Tax=Aspergillus nomiae NRRL (strain ATCC 15546 / NRRL 13137 / CBS 260.88 / M93) TaxID=1509407 RepID=A0A0L1IWY4_ASPN3|nr:uncharacterized protein ANOM_007834 [Aspergillus nomiae NRRL 13137]KNG83703.1 hypothetical protein ANOM_007834 [Aspergillus nomiae NRRL 13137]